MKKLIKSVFSRLGYDIVPSRWQEVTPDKEQGFDEGFEQLASLCRPHTMTSDAKLHALYRAVRYLDVNNIRGDFVECGVAAGGSMMMAAYTLLEQSSAPTREIHLYDTFLGMPRPSEKDVNYRGDVALKQWQQSERTTHNDWWYTPIDDVKQNLISTGFPEPQLHFIKGKVQETIPAHAPAEIALLRLDTDWYESTAHELQHLYPLLARGGVLIIDDYGHWEGCRLATDEYFTSVRPLPLLNRIDRLGVIAVKP